MSNGIFVDCFSKEELLAQFAILHNKIAELESRLSFETDRPLSLTELAKRTGYCKAQIRRIITKRSIPFEYEGKEIIIEREHIGKFRMKPGYHNI